MQHATAREEEQPLFATVTFVYSDESTGSTFRVPITRETTVRRLAKDAMQRLVLSRRIAGQKTVPAIVVTEVFVRGAGPQSKAEVFAHDVVTQVVHVKEEVIFMSVHTHAEVEKPTAAPSPPPPPPVPPPPSHSAPSSPPHDESALAHDESAPATSDAAADVTRPPVELAASVQTRKRRRELDAAAAVVDGGDTIQRLREREKARLGWGPEAHKHFAPNYVSSPEKLMRARFTKAKQTTTRQTRPSRSDVAQDKGARKTTKTTAQPVARTAASRSQHTTTEPSSRPRDGVDEDEVQVRLPKGWGPDALRMFPLNYVSSPDRLAREIRQRRKREKAEAAQKERDKVIDLDEEKVEVRQGDGAAAVVAVAHKVARQLHFSEAETQQETESPEGRPTVAHPAAPLLGSSELAVTPPQSAGADPAKGKTVHFASLPTSAHEFLNARGDGGLAVHTQ